MHRRELLAATAAALAARLLPGCGVRVSGVQDAADLPQELPPLTPADELYVYQCCGQPVVSADAWAIPIRVGGVEVATLTPDVLDGLGANPWEQTLQCIGADPDSLQIGNVVWGGRPLADVLSALGVDVPDDVVEIAVYGADGYHTSLPIEDLDSPVQLIWELDGAPLSAAHGAPVRLIVPGRYGMKNPKWIVDMDLVDAHHLGFWEEYGWSWEARVQVTSFILSPTPDALISGGPIRLLGVATAGDDAVARVEVSIDGGQTWTDAVLDYAPGPNVWATWHHDVDPPGKGVITARVRTTSASGTTSTADPDGTSPLEGYDGSMEVSFRAV